MAGREGKGLRDNWRDSTPIMFREDSSDEAINSLTIDTTLVSSTKIADDN
jgi:hypothetical protein